MGFQKNQIVVHFSAYVITNFGQTVCITGNCPELGNWDPSKGFKLQTNPKQYPIWFSQNPITLQKLTNIQFKLCILGHEGNVIRWQNLKLNRNLSLKGSCSIFLTEGQSQAQYEEQLQDTTSTKINSTKNGCLSEIQQESDDDEFNKENLVHQNGAQERKRSGSSGRSNCNQQSFEQKSYSNKNIDSRSQKYK